MLEVRSKSEELDVYQIDKSTKLFARRADFLGKVNNQIHVSNAVVEERNDMECMHREFMLYTQFVFKEIREAENKKKIEEAEAAKQAEQLIGQLLPEKYLVSILLNLPTILRPGQ